MSEIKTSMGILKAKPYDDGIAQGLEIRLGDTIIALIDVYADGTNARAVLYELAEECDEPREIYDFN